MRTNIYTPVMLVVFMMALANVAFAGEARIMSDHELDQVHAGGLNFDFGKRLGNVSSVTDTVTKGGVSDLSSGRNAKLNFNNGSIQFISLPKAPRAPDLPKPPDISSLKTEVKPAESVANALALAATDVSSAVTDMAGSGVSVLADSNLPVLSDSVPPVPLDSVPPVTDDSVPAVTSADPVVFADPLASQQQSISTDTVDAQMPDDLMVLVDTPSGQQMGVVIDGNSLAALQEGNGNVSVLNVSDTAQQFLHTLANVNAVNSTVPVQINMVVLVNSIVENMTNTNTLNMNTTRTFQF